MQHLETVNSGIDHAWLLELVNMHPWISDIAIQTGRRVQLLENRVWNALDIVPTQDAINSLIRHGRELAKAETADRVSSPAETGRDFAISADVGSRHVVFRYHATKDRFGPCVSVRVLHRRPPSLEEAGITGWNFAETAKMNTHRGGLFLVTGPTSSGKSTTIASMVDQYAKLVGGRVVTLEDPIEIPFDEPWHFATQREVGVEVPSWEAGILSSLRERVDLLVVGEIRTREALLATLRAASTGMLVIATTHAMAIREIPSRLALEVPASEKEVLLAKLATVLRGAISQRLLPGLKCPALLYELALADRQLQAAIAKGEPAAIQEAMGHRGQMVSMDFSTCLSKLSTAGKISQQTAETWKLAVADLGRI